MHIDKENSAMVFENDRKERPTHPDYTGRANIKGTQFYVSMWEKPGRNGPYYSLSFRPVEDEDGAQRERPQFGRPSGSEAKTQGKDFNDEIPF